MSVEHCLACFEALDARLSKRKALPLAEIQSSYAGFLTASAAEPLPPRDPALARVLAASSSSSSSTSLTASPTPSSGGGSSTPATSTSSSTLDLSSAPFFVTWNTLEADGDVSLRGCIGTFESMPLADGIPEYALISAMEDTRFEPISADELPDLQAAVTLLTDFEEVDDPRDWELGLHGIRLAFRDRGRRFSATYLPDVATEQGWSRDETLRSLVRKAGWFGTRDGWKSLELKVTRYQGKKARAGYDEYREWKDWYVKHK